MLKNTAREYGADEHSAHWFATTHWSVVLAANEADLPHAVEALEKLCRTYWYPIYAYVRRAGCRSEDAQDLTQGFFARLLQRKDINTVEPHKGKFRTFLLVALNHFLVDEARRAKSEKRGGGKALLSLDDEQAEDRYLLEAASELTQEKAFDQRWAVAVLDRAAARPREGIYLRWQVPAL